MPKPKQYLIKLFFHSLGNDSSNTDYQVHMAFPDTYAYSIENATLLAEHLKKTLNADRYEVFKS